MQRVLAAFLIVFGLVAPAAANDNYREPDPALTALVDAPLQPASSVSPDKRWLAAFERKWVKSLEEISRDELKLAGIRIDPLTFSRSRASTYHSAALHDLQTGEVIAIDGLPADGRIDSPSWSSDSEHLAFTLDHEGKLTLWVYDVADDSVRQLSDRPLNGVLTSRPYQWLPDGSGLLVNLAVNHGQPLPQPGIAALAPVIQETDPDNKAPVRTYQDLLETPADAERFEFLATGRLARVGLDGGLSELAKPGLVAGFDPSPDTNYILLETIEKPFSYSVPYSRFPLTSVVLDAEGNAVRTIAELPLAENIPKGFDSVRTGRRSIQWRADAPATLVWAEAQDGGDMSADVEIHDRVSAWAAPFEGEPETLIETERRFAGLEWGTDELAVFIDWRFADRMIRVWRFEPGNPEVAPVLFNERSYNDVYNDPGTPVTTRGEYGTRVIHVFDGSKVLLRGDGASPEGNIPFLDRHDFATGETERLWHSEAPYYERVVEVLDATGEELLTLREARDEQPNFFVRNRAEDTLTQVSEFPHPHPQMTGISKELVQYKRDDGVDLSGTLYLPPGYEEGDGPLPVLMWAYPLEYKDSSVAGQVRESPYEFNQVSFWGPLPYLALGYAVFDDPKMPIVGTGEAQPNDNFRPQLVASAQAAVDVLVERGVADPERIAIAGHSYGAFMVANLLAHSDLFAAGIARSGAYNRSLTPFGFQGEERDFWEAQDVYATVSPFFHAEKIDEPMLMIHGMEDNNSGTYPMQSERMFDALKGLGAQARLVMLPHESHGYRARASLLHMLWEQQAWLETYLGGGAD
ncbi:S9 family peptidase [Wenzhouxiangella sediminis]|uniref:S9 family peptidase n=1 Tax=Wenzhouxiangella sediminis TaxID=1792836 RepID=A0A3E1K8G1_9GAMM|nr:prolyl oligopeptidase family serine peptidase [Wenzhouxiangella sediminis]RFF30357.1 S9 family peptidase [Wenzhouxiangella sediminis]